MNFRTTIILLILLIGAGVFFIVANNSEDPPKKASPTAADESGRKLFDVKSADIKKISVVPGAGVANSSQPLEMTKVDDEWKITKPINWAADSFEGGNLVDTIVDLRSSATIDLTDKNRSGTGLASPRYTVELTDTNGKVHKLLVGERSELGRLYVQSGGETATASVITEGRLAEKLGKGTDGLVANIRDKKLVGISTFDAKQMEITVGGRKLSLVKDANAWKLTSPVDLAADMSEVSDILTTISNLRADAFSNEATATSRGAKFEQPRAVVTLSTAAPATQPATGPASQPAARTVTVYIGQPTDITEEKVWVKVSDPASVATVSLSKSSFEKIADATVLSLRDRRVFDLDPETVSEVSLTTETSGATQPSQKQSLKIERRKENLELGPQMPKPEAGPAAAPATSPATKPSASQSGHLSWVAWASTLARGASLTTLLQSEGAPATKPAVPATLPTTMPSAVASPAGTQPTTTPAAIQPAALPVMPEPPPPPKTKWVLGSAKGADADDATVSNLLFDLHPLRATKFLAAMPAAPAGTQPATQPATSVYVLTVKAVAAGGKATTYELKVTDRGGDTKPIGQYQDLIFELDRAFVDKLKNKFDGTDKAPAPPPRPQGMPQGFPGGGFPGGFPE
ncbi:DUF4340 domain-containing protein [Humisphaera borealis]|uniref:DUF4340 domain-containing protein n=1 Tax=Humisphaera borealis TaxID=2807512 RepID=A0A7M2WU84_9BACT|nr:DUF4340 domain-containing protein [Humisphaera borealis]QOV89085.1 DUF4340 domain-containing protein [Humisphaera borealis]